MRLTRCFVCWACTAILTVLLLQAVVYLGMFKTSRLSLTSTSKSSITVMESLSVSFTYRRWLANQVDIGRPKRGTTKQPEFYSTLPPEQLDALADDCTQVVDIPKVALLFLTKGDLPHKALWTMWFQSAAGQLPTNVKYNQYLNKDARQGGDEDGDGDGKGDDGDAAQGEEVGKVSREDVVSSLLMNLKAVENVTVSDIAADAGSSGLASASSASNATAEGRVLSLQPVVALPMQRRLLQEDVPPEGTMLTEAHGLRELDQDVRGVLTTMVDRCQRLLDPDTHIVQRQYLFSLYLHTPPHYNITPDPVFAPAVVEDRLHTAWGSHNLTRASKRLLQVALQEPRNQWFILVSESCVPLYPPMLVYQQLVHTHLSRINACRKDYRDNRDVRRWTHKMTSGFLKRRHWRKSWQWFGIIRKHAQLVVDDTHVDDIFHAHCIPGFDKTYRRFRDCYSDEHYIPTLLAANHLERETDCTGFLNYVDWSLNEAHPMSFSSRNISLDTLLSMRNPDCGGQAAMQAATEMFVDVSTLQRVEAESHQALSTNTSVLPLEDVYAGVVMGSGCPLFARKFKPDSSSVMLSLVRDCSNELGIVSEEFCVARDPPASSAAAWLVYGSGAAVCVCCALCMFAMGQSWRGHKKH